jgi:hypothetical protein
MLGAVNCEPLEATGADAKAGMEIIETATTAAVRMDVFMMKRCASTHVPFGHSRSFVVLHPARPGRSGRP